MTRTCGETRSRLLLVLVSVLLVLFCLELGLRLTAYRKSAREGGFHADRWAAPERTLGWISRPGAWDVDIHDTPMTILEHGERLTTGQEGRDDAPVCLLLGGSYMQGYGVADDATIASELARLLPGWRFVNLSVPGYGTHQAHLLLQRWVAEHETLPRLVIYGYIDHHGLRNIASYAWMKGLSSYKGVHLIPPHLELDEDGTWRERPYAEVNFLGLADKLSLVYFLQDVFLRLTRSDATDNAPLATCESLGRMRRFCQERGIAFAVANIWKDREPWSEAVRQCAVEEGFAYADCSLGIEFKDPEWFLQDDQRISGHTNEQYQVRMAQCIADKIPLP